MVVHRRVLFLVCLAPACGEQSAPAEAPSPSSSSSDATDLTGTLDEDSLGAQLFQAGFDPQRVDWQLVREQPTGWRIVGDTFELWSLPGMIWSDVNTLQNVAVRPTPVEFTASVVVTAEVTQNAEQAGLLWYRDDDNYVKLVKEQSAGAGGAIVVLMATEIGGNPTVHERIPLVGDRAELRMEVTPDAVRGEFRPDAATPWADLFTTAFQGKGARLGLFSQGAPEGVERWATFSAFAI